MNGFLLIDKPEGISSFGVVARVRRILKEEKAGHCGTLDPLATGLLIICLGKATRLAQFVSGCKKSYVAEIMLGWTSPTYDRGGELIATDFDGVVTSEDLGSTLTGLTGAIRQVAPAYSALKHKGRPLYDYARKGIPVEPKEREVVIESLELIEYDYPHLMISVTCSSGTYIRSLAHDIGARLRCGGYIENLRRTDIGGHSVSDATTLDQLERLFQGNAGAEYVRPLEPQSVLPQKAFISMDKMLDLPAVYVESRCADDVSRGVPIRVKDIVESDRSLVPRQVIALRNQQGNLLAVGRSLYASDQMRDLHDEKAVEYIRVI